MLTQAILATFNELLEAAGAAGEREPTAMTLATAEPGGRISARTVLMKAVDARGFVFHTNTLSLKGRQLAANPRAALCFHWKSLRDGVQVRIEGGVARVSEAESDAYFATRPRESQLGAWASLQSETLERREAFEARLAQYEQRFALGEVARPPHWGGYRVAPELVEFWYGAAFRLHERQLHEYRDGAWRVRMLYP
ncbi:MAG TPA: pyridoxamine 5'-phosphate oxidase [Candidatus Saccharimonadia bacterium]|nr:pyridoxamine 5'-phosphate oxidase [Candidatus Saccharimonadia bacterium]